MQNDRDVEDVVHSELIYNWRGPGVQAENGSLYSGFYLFGSGAVSVEQATD